MKADEWDDSCIYESLQQILLRSHGDHLPPIFRRRRVADRTGQLVAIRINEWKGIVDEYAQSKVRGYMRTVRSVKGRPLPPILDHVLDDLNSPLSILAGRAFFADKMKFQRAMLKGIRKQSQKGVNASRQRAAAVHRAIPRTKRTWGGIDIIFTIWPYRAERRLLWLYVRAELEQAGCSPAARGDMAKARSRKAIEEMLAALPWFTTHYQLSVGRIYAGVQQAEQADNETAKRFRFKSANALQKFISTYRPSR